MKPHDKYIELPAYDDQGRNLVDPSDRLGRKTAYITLLQSKAIERYVGGGLGRALDLGCGYGRMSGVLRDLGWDVIGLDPSLRVLSTAAALTPEGKYCVGQLPSLPFLDQVFDLVVAQNLLRVLHLNGVLPFAEGIPRVVRKGGRLVVVDNIRKGHRDYVPEEFLVEKFTKQGFRLVNRVAIRSARWWAIYLIRYCLIPSSTFDRLASYELDRMALKRRAPSWQYHNVLFVFEKFV